MKARLAVVLAVACGMLMGTQLFAHHGTGISYDMHKTVVVKGVITKFAFQNPHSQLYFDVTDPQGNVVHWAAEMRAPGNLEVRIDVLHMDDYPSPRSAERRGRR